jgi:glycosyltransferase involved in cell wall biosynthesis
MSGVLASIVLPVYNQADHIGGVLDEYAACLESAGLAYELLPVVNGPRRDASLDICREKGARNPAIRTVCIDDGGWGKAVRAGVWEARGDLLCFTNSARTTGRELAAVVLEGARHPEAVVKARREIRDKLHRRLGSWLYNLECRLLFGLPVGDVNGTPKVFGRRHARLLELKRDDDLIDLEFNVICRSERYPLIEIPIYHSRRRAPGSTTNLKSAVRMYRGALLLWSEMKAAGRAAE